jgi:hypothetical protein
VLSARSNHFRGVGRNVMLDLRAAANSPTSQAETGDTKT